MTRLAWDQVREDWVVDGGLRDIYVHETTRDDWQRVVDALRATGWPTTFSVDGDECEIPADVSGIFALVDQSTSWRIRPHPDVQINCFFFTEGEIELDADPREIAGQAELDAVCELVLVIGRALGRQVDVTGESAPSDVFMYYDPRTDQLIRRPYHSPWME
jgi:hypothetical protein